MTCFEKYMTEHELPVRDCPHDYGYAKKPDNCYCISCYKDCWAREVEENAGKKEGGKR